MEKTRILIADDEPVNLEFFDVTLSRLGFDVEKASDGYETLEKVKTFEPDLVILDNIMPGLSGWKVTSLLKTSDEYAEYRDIPIIMLSAMDSVKDKVEGFELGVEDYITEPFNFSEVLARIRAVLKTRELSRQVIAREKRLSVLESLNESLKYFTVHLKKPMQELANECSELDLNDADAVKNIIEKIKNESREVIAAVDALEDEINEFEENSDSFFSGQSMKDLEEKFSRHFRALGEEDFNKEAPV